MIIRLGMAPRREGLDFEEFQRHWRTSHADVVSNLPGLRRYQQFHAVLDDGQPLRPYPGFDACSALRFDTAEAMDAAFESAEFVNAVVADEAEFVDKTRFLGVVGSWRPDSGADLGSEGPIQVLTLVTAESGTSPQKLAGRLSAGPAGMSSGAIVADRAVHAGRFPVAADVVRVVGYGDIASALHGAAATRDAAGTAQIVGEHLAQIVDVPLGDGSTGLANERTKA